MSTSIQLIVGLGNPGDTYSDTRHNAGVWFIETLAQRHDVALSLESKFHGLSGRLRLQGQDCRLLIPNTFMNNSGQAVQAFVNYYQIEPTAILIAHDELDLACGTARLKYDGGHGGHNGLRDIINKLQVRNFHRLRLGIDRPTHKDKVVDYVLNKPSKQQRALIQDSIEAAMDVLPLCLNGQIEKAMQLLHTAKAE